MNRSFDYQKTAGPEPSTKDYGDPRRWDKWMAWDKRMSNHFPHSFVRETDDLRIIYSRPMKSQITERMRLAKMDSERRAICRMRDMMRFREGRQSYPADYHARLEAVKNAKTPILYG